MPQYERSGPFRPLSCEASRTDLPFERGVALDGPRMRARPRSGREPRPRILGTLQLRTGNPTHVARATDLRLQSIVRAPPNAPVLALGDRPSMGARGRDRVVRISRRYRSEQHHGTLHGSPACPRRGRTAEPAAAGHDAHLRGTSMGTATGTEPTSRLRRGSPIRERLGLHPLAMKVLVSGTSSA